MCGARSACIESVHKAQRESLHFQHDSLDERLESDSTATAGRERKEMFPGISLGCWLARWHQGGGGGPWRGGRRAVGLGRCSPSANMGGGEMSRAVCLRLLIGRQCFDVQRDSARAQAAGPIVGEIVKSHLV
jgi:hypothetical protein